MHPINELSTPLLEDVNPQNTRRSQDTMIVVGIFSRDDPSCYQWLINMVLACGNVRDVRTVTITNSFQNFREETLKCDFAILYHSKNRGRINVTDVVDSLYDEELQCLSSVYGRKHVLVVIDDLDSSSEEEKSRILSHQPSIGAFAQDLFIFSSADKTALNAGGYQASTGAQRALDDMKRTVEACKKRVFHVRPRTMIIIGGLIVSVIILVLIVLSVHKTDVPGTTTPVPTTVTPRTLSSHQ